MECGNQANSSKAIKTLGQKGGGEGDHYVKIGWLKSKSTRGLPSAGLKITPFLTEGENSKGSDESAYNAGRK